MKSSLTTILRPQTFSDVIGQDHLVSESGIINKMFTKNKIMSMILYGQAGCGKTTIARIIASTLDWSFVELNATNSNKKDLESAIAQARLCDNFIIIVDEIHRLNKDKQDILLPYIENNTFVLIGLTNSNPYHSINTAIRSRTILLEVKTISTKDILQYLYTKQAYTQINREEDFAKVANYIASCSNGDIRFSINQLELADILYEEDIDIDELLIKLGRNVLIDKNSDYYYDAISSLQKSIRGSDVNAALIYLAILIVAEDLDIIERRLSVIAYEDIGLANPSVVDRTFHALETARKVGFPEARIPLAFCVIDLALSPKSNAAYSALDEAISYVTHNTVTFNEYMRQTPNDITSKKNYSLIPYVEKYRLQYLPNSLRNKRFYKPYNKTKYEKYLSDMNEYLNTVDREGDINKLINKLRKEGKI